MEQEIIVDVIDCCKDYIGKGGTTHALNHISFAVHKGEWIGIRGPSGAGKSTLVNMLSGVDRPSNGEIRICGEVINKMGQNKLSRFRGKHIGVILQSFQLMPTLNNVQNVILPMDLCHLYTANERYERAMMILQQMGLEEHARKIPSQLSGGQQQRLAIARALANDPPLLLGDEPTGSLDSKTAASIITIFQDLVAKGKTLIIVSHDPDLDAYVHRSLWLKDGVLSNNMDEEN